MVMLHNITVNTIFHLMHKFLLNTFIRMMWLLKLFHIPPPKKKCAPDLFLEMPIMNIS